MNAATFIVLIAVIAIIGLAAYRVYLMVRDNDMCYACKGCRKCKNPINCTIREK